MNERTCPVTNDLSWIPSTHVKAGETPHSCPLTYTHTSNTHNNKKTVKRVLPGSTHIQPNCRGWIWCIEALIFSPPSASISPAPGIQAPLPDSVGTAHNVCTHTPLCVIGSKSFFKYYCKCNLKETPGPGGGNFL